MFFLNLSYVGSARWRNKELYIVSLFIDRLEDTRRGFVRKPILSPFAILHLLRVYTIFPIQVRKSDTKAAIRRFYYILRIHQTKLLTTTKPVGKCCFGRKPKQTFRTLLYIAKQ